MTTFSSQASVWGLRLLTAALLFSVNAYSVSLRPWVQSSRALSTTRYATWSNGQAIQEYKDFLAGGASAGKDQASDRPSVVVGTSLLADAIAKMGEDRDLRLPSLDDPIPTEWASPDGTEVTKPVPVYLCPSSPEELDAALAKHLQKSWSDGNVRDDLVFCTTPHCNLEPILSKYGLPRDATNQLLVSFKIPDDISTNPLSFRRIEDLSVALPRDDAQGLPNHAFRSATCGKWKEAMAERLGKAEISCDVLFYREWRRRMWERNVFDAVFPLIGACATGPDSNGPTLAEVAEFYGDDASEMAWQLSGMLRGSRAITLSYGFEERMYEYSVQRGKDTVCELHAKDWNHCNGIYLATSYKGLTSGFGDPAPLHTEYVDFALNERGLLAEARDSIELPDLNQMGVQRKAIIREGNLRADGVI